MPDQKILSRESLSPAPSQALSARQPVMAAEIGTDKKPLSCVEPPSVPLPDVVYERQQKPPFSNFIFYLRERPDRVRPYQPKSHKLYLLGVWDLDRNGGNNPPSEYAFSADDQVAMFKFVFENIVNPDERRRFVGKIKKIIETAGEQDKLHTGDE